MNSRERVKKAIHFQEPDRAPISHAVLPAAYLKYGEPLKELLAEYREDFGWDFMEDLPIEKYPALYKKGKNRDDFGTLWQGEELGICGIPIDWPIKDLERYDEYRWPNDFTAGPPSGRQYSGHMMGYNDRWYARGAWLTFFEQLQQLRGMENFFIDIVEESNNFHRLVDDMLAFNLRWIEQWTCLEYDGLHFADDWGEQARLLINPKKWRKIFKPAYAEMFKKVHDAGMDVWYHTDGHINEVFDDFLEIGVDVINCQAAVIGLDFLREHGRGKVCFRTDIDRQKVMPFGSPSQVKEEVHKVFEMLGTPKGGIIACGELSIDVSFENIRAMYEAFREYGKY